MDTDKMLVEAQYFPNLEYFINILEYETVYIEAWETYQKQSYRNRCHILTSNKVNTLTVPVMNPTRNILIRDIKIDYNQRWMNDHWGAIRSGYGKAPFFEYYADFFQDILSKKHTFLFDMNMELMTVCLKLLGVNKKMEFTSFFEKNPGPGLVDLRSAIHPKKVNPSYIITWSRYPQIFGRYFVTNLSILDLLFCEGANSINILGQSKKIYSK